LTLSTANNSSAYNESLAPAPGYYRANATGPYIYINSKMHVVNKCAKFVACLCVHVLFSISLCICTSQSFYVVFSDTFNWPRSIFRVAFSRVHGCRYFYVHFETGAMHILQVEWIHLCVSTREPDPLFETLYKGWWTQ
jgi:hypothetical protein